MDYNWTTVENPTLFPPKEIWVWWDLSGEFMDVTNDPDQAKHWMETSGGHIAHYQVDR